MDGSKKINISEIVKKPLFKIGIVLVVMLLVFMVFFSGGGGSGGGGIDVDSQNLVNRYESLEKLIEGPAREVNSAKLKANLSQVLIVLSADRTELTNFYTENIKPKKPAKPTVSSKPDKELETKLKDAKNENNLNPEIIRVTSDQLKEISSNIEKIKKEKPDDKKLLALMNKLSLNVQTMQSRLNEGY